MNWQIALSFALLLALVAAWITFGVLAARELRDIDIAVGRRDWASTPKGRVVMFGLRTAAGLIAYIAFGSRDDPRDPPRDDQ